MECNGSIGRQRVFQGEIACVPGHKRFVVMSVQSKSEVPDIRREPESKSELLAEVPKAHVRLKDAPRSKIVLRWQVEGKILLANLLQEA